MDIFSTVPISFRVAALGGTIRIKTVDGEVEYDVKPGTQTDTRIRLRGKGMPSLRNKEYQRRSLCHPGSGSSDYLKPWGKRGIERV